MLSSHTTKRAWALLAALIVALLTSTAGAEPPEQEDAHATGQGHDFAQTNKVHPMMVDQRIGRDIAVAKIAMSQDKLDKKALQKKRNFLSAATSSSSAFAGKATPDDLWAFKAGMVLTYPSDAESTTEEPTAAQNWLTNNQQAVGKLSEDAKAAIEPCLAASSQKKRTCDWGRLFGAALSGMHTGDERLHGYLAAGMWTGLVHAALVYNTIPSALAPTGRTLIAAFQKDALLDGADREIAKQLEAILAEVESDKGDADKVLATTDKIMNLIAKRSKKSGS